MSWTKERHENLKAWAQVCHDIGDNPNAETLDALQEIERLRALLMELAGEESLSDNQYTSDLMRLRRQNRIMREALESIQTMIHPYRSWCETAEKALNKLNEKGEG